MTLPRTVADVLSRHVTFEIESIDRSIGVLQHLPSAAEAVDARPGPGLLHPDAAYRPPDRDRDGGFSP